MMMKYYFMIVEMPNRNPQKNICFSVGDGWCCFVDADNNDGPERVAYLKWVAEGNEAEPWDAEAQE